MPKAQARKMARLLGAWSRSIRELHNFTQEQWAEMLEINQSAVTRIEKGTQNLLTAQYLVIKNNFTVKIIIEKEEEEEEEEGEEKQCDSVKNTG